MTQKSKKKLKIFENVQTLPIASESSDRMHPTASGIPNGSEWIRMGQNTSDILERLAKTSKNLAKTRKNFANISVKTFSMAQYVRPKLKTFTES